MSLLGLARLLCTIHFGKPERVRLDRVEIEGDTAYVDVTVMMPVSLERIEFSVLVD